MIEWLLPRSDVGVLIQIVATLTVGPGFIWWLARRGLGDVAWFAAGLLALWVAFIAWRALH